MSKHIKNLTTGLLLATGACGADYARPGDQAALNSAVSAYAPSSSDYSPNQVGKLVFNDPEHIGEQIAGQKHNVEVEAHKDAAAKMAALGKAGFCEDTSQAGALLDEARKKNLRITNNPTMWNAGVGLGNYGIAERVMVAARQSDEARMDSTYSATLKKSHETQCGARKTTTTKASSHAAARTSAGVAPNRPPIPAMHCETGATCTINTGTLLERVQASRKDSTEHQL